MSFSGHSPRACVVLLITVLSPCLYGQTADNQLPGTAAAKTDASSTAIERSSTSSPTPAPQQPTTKPASTDNDRAASAVPGPFLRNLAYDQKTIWTSPFKAKVQDLNWIVPFVGLTAGMINADAELSSRIDTTGTFAQHGGTISNAGLAAMVAGGGGLYFLGKLRSDDHQRETGIVAGEAAVNSVIVAEVLKMISRRQRPTDGTGQGLFFKNGSVINSSFPSVHAMASWSIASAVAHEYPGPLTEAFGYGAATVISLARVYGKDHFPSDVIAGATMGWLIGRQVYASHHRPDLPGGDYGTFHSSTPGEEASVQDEFSAYVPMDSWVYTAIDRLAGLGVINSNFAGLRPWTRAECARLIEEAEGSIDEDSGDEGSRLYKALALEFAPELNGEAGPYASLDSVYAGVTGISGTPLTDDYHFGSTMVNNFGRPFQHGANGQAGFSASGSAGMLGFYVQGEYEHAPGAPAVPQSVQDAIQFADFKPPAPALATPAFNQFRLLDTYIALNVNGWQTSFGKQSLWLGPTEDPVLWSNNAEPIYMLRVDQTTPKQLPSLLKYLGPYRIEFWVGKMTGHHFIETQGEGVAVELGRTLPQQPLVHGTKINFKPTPNFEFGVGVTGVFGGPNFPITLGSLKHVLFSTTNAQGRGQDPGDRRSSFDFKWRLPGLRNWLTLYNDSFVEDEISPIGYPRRAAHNPGLYLSHVPFIPHLDMRVEAAYTNLPGLIQPPQGGGFFYWNVRYFDGYTNKGHIMGNATVGRQGIAARVDSTYWVASDKTIQFGYRSNIADSAFVGGGNLRDYFIKSEWSFSRHVSLSSLLQYEYWNFPVLDLGKKQNDFTASFQLTYWPHRRLKGGR